MTNIMECTICLEEKKQEEFVKRVCNCEHDQKICRLCHENFLNSNPEMVGGIKCMVKSCKALYEKLAIRTIIGLEKEKVLSARIEEKTHLAKENTVVCSRTNCGELLSFCKGDNVVTCSSCAFVMCVLCFCDGHEGLTCLEYEETKQSAHTYTLTSQQLINLATKRCPNCRFRVWKNGGCPHMSCLNCRFQFCFGCLKEKGGSSNYSHSNCAQKSMEFESSIAKQLKEIKVKRREMERQLRIEASLRRRAEVRQLREKNEPPEEIDGNLLCLLLNNELSVFEAENTQIAETQEKLEKSDVLKTRRRLLSMSM